MSKFEFRGARVVVAAGLGLTLALGATPLVAKADSIVAPAEGSLPAEQAQDNSSLPEPVNGVITLSADVTIDSLDALLNASSIDLGGHTLTYTGSVGCSIQPGQSLSISNGTFIATRIQGSTTALFNILKSSSIELQSATLITSGAALYPQGDAASVTVTDSWIYAPVYAVATNAGAAENYGVKITLSNSSFVNAMSSDGDGCPVLLNVPGTLTMTDCYVVGTRQGVIVRGGTANIVRSVVDVRPTSGDAELPRGVEGSPLYGSTDKYLNGDWGSGNEVPVGGLIVGNRSSEYKYPCDVHLSETTITTQGGFPKAYIYGMSEEGRAVSFVHDESLDSGDIAHGDGSAAKVSSEVASLGGVSYASIQDAVDAATETSNVITIAPGTHELADDESIVINKAVAIVGADSTSKVVGKGTASAGHGLFTFTAGGEGGCLSDFAIEYTGTSSDCAAVYFDPSYGEGDSDSQSSISEIDGVQITGVGEGDTNQAIGILASYTTRGDVEVKGCTLKNLKYGIYVNGGLNSIAITGNTIDGTRYNAVNIAGDDVAKPCYSVTISDNTLTGISSGNYTDDTYSSGINIGPNVPEVIMSGNVITMLNDKKPVNYVENGNRLFINYVVDGSAYADIAVLPSDFNRNDYFHPVPSDPSDKPGYVFSGWDYGAYSQNVKVINGIALISIPEGATRPTALTVTARFTPIPSTGGGSTPSRPSDSETVTNPDGSTTTTTTENTTDASGNKVETVTEVTKGGEDGSTTEKVTETVTSSSGEKTVTVTETTTLADGTTATAVSDGEGKVSSVEVEVSQKAADAGVVTIPTPPVQAPTDAADAPEVKVSVPVGGATVVVPVAGDATQQVSPSAVLVLVGEDGEETVLPKSALTDDGLMISVDDDVTVKVVDRAVSFDDVTGDEWFADEIAPFASSRGIMTGMDTEDGVRFAGAEGTSRAMFVTMLSRVELADSDASDIDFSDVTASDWYAGAAAWGAETGVVNGYDNGAFGGADPVTREQMAVFLMRYAESLGLDTSARTDVSFPDSGSVSDFADEAMSWAIAEGIFKGGDDGMLHPQDSASRADAATVIARFINGVMYA